MADKKTPIADNQVGQLAEQMAEKVKESANQIWLAGLGAYSKAEEEGGPSDLAGSAGIYRLREELMTRLNNTIETDLVKDILFSEILVQ